MARQKKEEVVEVQPIKRDNSKRKDYILTVGRRRSAVARVRLYAKSAQAAWGELPLGKGEILINKKPISEYFVGPVAKAVYEAPLKATNTLGQLSATISVAGGGNQGQLEATVHGIARALSEMDREKFRPILKKAGFLTRDPRTRERRKAGMGGKSRRKRQSPKR